MAINKVQKFYNLTLESGGDESQFDSLKQSHKDELPDSCTVIGENEYESDTGDIYYELTIEHEE